MQETILPKLYAETVEHKDRLRVVDYGAFKKKMDDGLPLRRAVYRCLATILDKLPRFLDDTPYKNNPDFKGKSHVQVFIAHVCNGLADDFPEMVASAVDIVNDLFIAKPQYMLT